jgi:hypothetical protein
MVVTCEFGNFKTADLFGLNINTSTGTGTGSTRAWAKLSGSGSNFRILSCAIYRF